MWVFGYGSLMSDGWETKRGCVRNEPATLHGYSRAFNKKSVRNWGTLENPGPTLNLVKADGTSCRGVAFAFPEDRKDAILIYLREREGKNFTLRSLPVRLDDGSELTAIVSLYEGRNLIATDDVRDIAAMVAKARGTDGACIDYVMGISGALARLNIKDPLVTELRRVLHHPDPAWRSSTIREEALDRAATF